MFTNMSAFLGKGRHISETHSPNQVFFLLFRAVASHKGN